MEKHCTNCEHFAWWDGDYCCVWKMKIIEKSENGAFWCPFPQDFQEDFNADKCEDYYFSEKPIYRKPYLDFINEIKNNGDENLSVNEYEEKYYQRIL